eukprot:gene29002-38371_t
MLAAILEDIVELGFLSIRQGQIVEETKPISNLYTENRWDPTILYIKDYTKYHEDFDGDFFVCIYDGWREYGEPVDSSQRRYAPWISLSRQDQLSYITRGSKGEPRFSHKSAGDPYLYPELPYKVLAYNRHIDDRNVRLIPDYEFIIHQFSQFMQQTLRYDIAFDEKLSKIFWRGTEHSMLTEYIYSYDGSAGSPNSPNAARIDQRNLLVVLSTQVVFDLDIRSILNSSFERTPMSEFFSYKYLLDVDGYVSAWSGGFWKLYSNSVVMKAPSLWEQWYYEDLKPYIHYLPLKTLHPKDIRD